MPRARSAARRRRQTSSAIAGDRRSPRERSPRPRASPAASPRAARLRAATRRPMRGTAGLSGRTASAAASRSGCRRPSASPWKRGRPSDDGSRTGRSGSTPPRTTTCPERDARPSTSSGRALATSPVRSSTCAPASSTYRTRPRSARGDRADSSAARSRGFRSDR